MNIKSIFLLIVVSCFLTSLHAQITGTVYSKDKNSKSELIGANIYWEGTQVGTASDFNGRFSINKPNNSNSLIISYVGYANDTIIVNSNKEELEIILSESNILKEVTVAERTMSSSFDRMNPLITQKINDEALKHAACCNLGESFETNASVDAAYSDAGTGAKQIRLLGLSGRYVQMMTENIPNFYGLASNYGLDYVPGPWMQSIAISKGTASVVYGYEALTGQINTWYKEPTHRSDNFFLNLFASSSGRTELNTDATYKLSERVRGMILVHTGNSWFEVDEDKDQFRDMPLLNRYFLFNRYNIDWNPNFETKLGVKLLYEDRQGGQVKSINNPYTISIGTRRAEAFLKSGYTFKGALHKSLAFLSSWSYHDQQGVYGFSTYDASQQSVYLNTIFTADLDEDDVHSVQTGLSFKYDAYIEDLNNLDMSRKEIVPGAFAEYSFSPSSAFLIVGGARLDYHNMYGMFFVPRMHLRYKLASLTTLKASVGKGIRTPAVLAENAYLLASSRTMQIAPDILPEMSWNYGGNIMQQIPIGNRDMTIVLDFYRTSFVDQVVVDLDDDLRKVSIYNLEGESYSNVGQIEIQYPFIKGMDLTAAFRYNDVKQNIAGVLREVPFTSRYKGLISASYKTALEKWQFDYTVQFNGGGRIPSTAANPEQYRREDRFDPYIIMNAQITKFFKKWEMYAGVENLTNFVQKNPIIAADNPNSEYFDAAMIWGPLHGRKFYLGMRYNINKN